MIHFRHEHDSRPLAEQQSDRYEALTLVRWDKPLNASKWGYYPYYQIGAEWFSEGEEAVVVTTKERLENIDFLRLFSGCFFSDLSFDKFSEIYTLHPSQPTIEAKGLDSVVSLLVIVHFLAVVSRLKSLKRGYVEREENIKKVKGRINLMQNERKNILMRRFDRIYCNFAEYTEDIPENRIIKKALIFSQRYLRRLAQGKPQEGRLLGQLQHALSRFEKVSDQATLREITGVKSHKLFRDYAEALRLAKQVLRHFDFNITNTAVTSHRVIPFTIDMSLLYEHYVYGLLHQAYGSKILYQQPGVTGFPDFLYTGRDFPSILDAKYIPKYENSRISPENIRQLSGYTRDLNLLRKLGYKDIEETTPLVAVPCVIIYPREAAKALNPFFGNSLKSLCRYAEKDLLQFYKICVPLPVV